MTIKNGSKYDNNYARAAAYFIATCAPQPATDEQTAAYNLITGMYSAIYRDAESCGFRTMPDVWFAPWEQQKERLNDVKTIREPVKKILAIISELFHLVISADAEQCSLVFNAECKKPSKAFAGTLSAAGVSVEKGKITLENGCIQGLQELAAIAQENAVPITEGQPESIAVLLFSRCIFEPQLNWTAMAFDKALGADGQLLWLCGELEKRGYKRLDCKDGNKITLDYVKLHGKKDEPVKASWADKSHYGIELSYEDLRLEPYYIWLRMADYKSVLEQCADFPENVTEFILGCTKSCDGCRYCVQTDKTGTRPLAAIAVKGKKKCPYFPAFSMNWRVLTSELAQNILATLDAAYSDEE